MKSSSSEKLKRHSLVMYIWAVVKWGQWMLLMSVCNVVNALWVLLCDTVMFIQTTLFSIFVFSFIFSINVSIFWWTVYNQESGISYSDAVSTCNHVSRGIRRALVPPPFSGQVAQSVFDPELPGQTIPRSEGPLGTFHSFYSNRSLLHSTSHWSDEHNG